MAADYREQYERAVRELTKAREQMDVLVKALKETQNQLDLQRVMNDAMVKAREGRDDD